MLVWMLNLSCKGKLLGVLGGRVSWARNIWIWVLVLGCCTGRSERTRVTWSVIGEDASWKRYTGTKPHKNLRHKHSCCVVQTYLCTIAPLYLQTSASQQQNKKCDCPFPTVLQVTPMQLYRFPAINTNSQNRQYQIMLQLGKGHPLCNQLKDWM